MKKGKYSVLNMYLTTTISISLVLFFIGSLIFLSFVTKEMTNKIHENISVSVVLNDDIDSTELVRVTDLLTIAPFTKEINYLSKEAARQEHIEDLGDDPAQFLGYNPLLASLEINLQKGYAHADSIKKLESLLTPFVGVKTVLYNKELIDIVGPNIVSIQYLLLLLAILLFGVALILISTTIRLSIYSKRFLINTMKLVGATPWVIRSPFVKKCCCMGFFASIIAMSGICGMLYFIQQELGIPSLLSDVELLGCVFAGILLLGFSMTFVSAYISVGKYIRMKTNDLYYI